ncbi:signal recognition particle-docking protein FtsY [Thermochromatium tepidum]|uniref:Signal recognition particle receptor FtsY n=1 Tax=Thermochromatium tepidum ATCC 43061 TaxID=316276 RepID=A0A6I6E6G9_THETI|nr:signal recognition particle-docking protein FtsY [Thermochromatium tepidum]QGU33442.1 signal recognition particle-docking protein FtsY [Thermochromatium tepidum ATCC 43061]
MFGFGKKNQTTAPSEPRSLDNREPSMPATASSESPAQPQAPSHAEAPKRPWFGKLFRSNKPATTELESVPAAAEPAREPSPPKARPLLTKPLEARAPVKAPEPVGSSSLVSPLPQLEPRSETEPPPKRSALARLRERLSKSRAQLGGGLGNLRRGRQKIDDELLEELETLLITADVGIETSTRLIADLSARVKRKKITDPETLFAALKEDLREILRAADGPVKQPAPGRPQVVLMVGVNGAGKTTTIGKLAKRLQEEGNSVMLAAGDTFRAAAIEQLATWGERNGVPVVAQHTGADSASVIFDALQAATARGIDVLIADTAGRLHTKTNLMDELSKVARVLKKLDPEAPHEVMLVVDATTGQNALTQAEHFHRALGLTGITLTKLDGTAKGGILFAIAERLRVPIRFIGVGESIEDLRPFDPDEFVEALFG